MIRKHAVLRNFLRYGLLSCAAFIWIIPLFYVFIAAMKSQSDFVTSPFLSLPRRVEWSNFSQAWTVGQLGIYMRNSLLICVIKVPLGILLESLAAFVLTRMDFRWSKLVFLFIFVGMIVPFQMTLVPLSIMGNELHLINTYFFLILMYLAFGLPFGVLVMRGFMRQIPKELDEAAKMDGCSDLRIYWNIILPICRPAVAALVILDFLATWNEFLLAQTFITNQDRLTLPAGLLQFTSQYSTNYTLMMAGVILSVIPVFVVYMAFQKYFVSGLQGAYR
ncbi:carbohydrate ABC transporter permease [Alicyclobacillus vulcanalis]|uniref:Carbohydrate ABC transporter membrane protein 2, CUT1 family n=1 Tax=Alicyclobacillus vulcanalis TaxID=252246 RepID=A0A1N7PG91_9BACL|nr:carbohydrate ABC transporter permease [Alicyclobacillus vulcanalis]SIT09624.1 carbohydrate ABC transporter membrane protein 2, CUT1 family [Alicyclobacillus vulcanalis]